MRLFKYVEMDSGALHWVIAGDENDAESLVLYHAGLLRDDKFLKEELDQVDVSPDEEFTFFSENNPITHTVKDWETIFSHIKKPFYLACSEY